jgi:hypothetical protein
MKSYFGNGQLTLQGKAWQIRIMLKQWLRNYQADILLKDVVAIQGAVEAKVAGYDE